MIRCMFMSFYTIILDILYLAVISMADVHYSLFYLNIFGNVQYLMNKCSEQLSNIHVRDRSYFSY